MEAARILVIGGGVAGASVAYFAAQAGGNVTVIDAGQARASDVPTALLNPVRGQSGQVEPRSLAGLHLSWALIRQLGAQGYPVVHEQQGVVRPLATDLARSKFERHLPPELLHHWLQPDKVPIALAPGWPHLLAVEEGGWLSGPSFVAALLAASGVRLISSRVMAWSAQNVTLESGQQLSAEVVVWCGGSVGASWGGGSGPESPVHTHRAGSVLLLPETPIALPVSAGVYFAPTLSSGGRRGGLIGATFEAPTRHHTATGPPLKSLHWLLTRAAALSADLSPTVGGVWSGSRLSGEQVGLQPGGWWALAGLGSKGFLLGPLLARNLVEMISAGPLSSPGK